MAGKRARFGLLIGVSAVVIALVGCSDSRSSGTAAPKAGRSSGAPSQATAPGSFGARAFVGSRSVPGLTLRSCRKSDCATLTAKTPAYVEAKPGQPVIFTVTESPLEATLSVEPPAGTATSVRLSPGTLMAWGPALAPGRYLVRLQAKFRAGSATWLFGVTIQDG